MSSSQPTVKRILSTVSVIELTRLIDKRSDHRIVAEYVDEAYQPATTPRRRVGFLQNLRDDASKAGSSISTRSSFGIKIRFGRIRSLIELADTIWLKPFRQAGVTARNDQPKGWSIGIDLTGPS